MKDGRATVCGKRLHVVHSNHLERHGLTIGEYLSAFPDAMIYSTRYVQSVKTNFWSTVGSKREKICVDCGAPFVTNAPNKVRCILCQRMYKLEAKRSRERLRRRSWRGVKQILGTKDASVNLKILPNGRIAAAVWLERKRGKNHKRMVNGGEIRCPDCSSTYLMLVGYNERYCIECGGKIMLAKENQHYTTAELCCSRCGLLYENPLLLLQDVET